MNEPTHLDLFSGVGTFSLAFESEGFRTIGFSETDSFASQVLKERWPNVPNYGDVRNVSCGCDVLTGGFPCQPFSQAGQRRGSSDDRYLWPAMLSAIRSSRPTWLLCENVAGILSMEFCDMLTCLEKEGYVTQTFLIPALAVGAIHGRNRVWVLAHSGSERRKEVNGISRELPERNRISFTPWGSNRILLSDLYRNRIWCFPDSDPERSFDGFAQWPHRLKAVGNAIVPQIAKVFASAIKITLANSGKL